MKKKIVTVAGIALCLCALFLNVSMNKDKGSNDINLLKLMNGSDAQAFGECAPYKYIHGKCYELSGNCFHDTDKEQCDPYGR